MHDVYFTERAIPGLHQDVHRRGRSDMLHLAPLMPEWYFLIFFLVVLSLIGAYWPPLLLTLLIFQESTNATATLFHVLKRENSRNGNGN